MAATLSESNVIEQEVRVNAPAQAIFPFFTDAQSIVRWMAVDATLDPRPGGVFRVNCPNELHVIEGRYLELEPPSRGRLHLGMEVDVRRVGCPRFQHCRG
jgi:uncharacterized protein YndB with AHSA1/START domain